MQRSCFSEEQITGMLKEQEAGVSTAMASVRASFHRCYGAELTSMAALSWCQQTGVGRRTPDIPGKISQKASE